MTCKGMQDGAWNIPANSRLEIMASLHEGTQLTTVTSGCITRDASSRTREVMVLLFLCCFVYTWNTTSSCLQIEWPNWQVMRREGPWEKRDFKTFPLETF